MKFSEFHQFRCNFERNCLNNTLLWHQFGAISLCYRWYVPNLVRFHSTYSHNITFSGLSAQMLMSWYSFGPRPKDIIAQAYMPEIKAIKDRKCLVLDQIHFLIFWQGYTCQRGLFLNFNENVELQLGKRALKSWIWAFFDILTFLRQF